eukprot:860834-Prymnesium_polylepis.1
MRWVPPGQACASRVRVSASPCHAKTARAREATRSRPLLLPLRGSACRQAVLTDEVLCLRLEGVDRLHLHRHPAVCLFRP